jgi:hypothetical protein
MATRPPRPLPRPPGPSRSYYNDCPLNNDLSPLAASHFAPYPYPAYAPPAHDPGEDARPMLPAGTLLHKGFYDLLAMIPTPSPSRLFQWGSNQSPPPSQPSVIVGPRYEPLGPPTNAPTIPVLSPASPLKKNRRISKDMVSNPTGFVCVFTRMAVTDDNDARTATLSMLLMPTRLRPFSLDGVQMEWESSEVCFCIVLTSALLEPSNSRSAVGQANQIPCETNQQSKSYQRGCQRLKALGDQFP